MADELISRQALAEEIESLTVTVAGKPARWYDAKHSVIRIIAEQPAVDAVEVVRCKDCKYSMLWRKPADEVIGDCWIRKMNSDDEQFPMVGADDFCSYGERREESG